MDVVYFLTSSEIFLKSKLHLKSPALKSSRRNRSSIMSFESADAIVQR